MELDLGTLAARDGAHATVRVGLASNGQPLTAADVFKDGHDRDALLTIAFKPDSRVVADAVTEFARVPFGQDFVLHGIPSGALMLQAQPAHGFEARPGVQRVDASPVLEAPVSSLGGRVLAVDVPVVRGVRRVFDVRAPDGATVAAPQLQVRNRATGRVDTLELIEQGRAPLLERVALLEPGVYDAWLTVMAQGAWLGRELQIDARDPQPSVVSVQLERAGEARGTVTNALGQPLAGVTVRWTPRRLAHSNVWLYPVRSQADGTFVVAGVPAGVELVRAGRPDEPLPPIVAGAPVEVGAVVVDPVVAGR